jgi:hypothetical protein
MNVLCDGYEVAEVVDEGDTVGVKDRGEVDGCRGTGGAVGMEILDAAARGSTASISSSVLL